MGPKANERSTRLTILTIIISVLFSFASCLKLLHFGTCFSLVNMLFFKHESFTTDFQFLAGFNLLRQRSNLLRASFRNIP